jgi:hypothetical protein
VSRYDYPEDEFDTLGADRVPQGVHRAPIPRWRQLLPFLIVLVLAPTLAFVAVRALSGGGDDAPPAAEPSVTATQEPTDDGGGEATEEPTTDEPTTEEPTTEEPPADLDYATLVVVLNGSGVGGLAADTTTRLGELGFTQTRAGDYSSSIPTVTTIYYDNADQADEAQAIGDALGIETLVEDSAAAQGAVVLVLRSDFALD